MCILDVVNNVVIIVMATPTRRGDPRHWILGTAPTSLDKTIKGGKLPTRKQVLLAFQARADESKHSGGRYLFNAAKETVIQEIVPIYGKAKIGTKKVDVMARDILKLQKQYQEMNKKNKDATRESDDVTKFKNKLEQTMPFWTKVTAAQVKEPEDRAYLESMQTDRKCTMAGVDKKDEKAQKKRSDRMAAERKLIEQEQQRLEASRSTSTTSDEEELIESVDADVEMEEVVPDKGDQRSHKRVVKSGETLFIPHNILSSPAMISVADRNKVSHTALASIVNTLISTCGGDIEKFSVSASSSYR